MRLSRKQQAIMEYLYSHGSITLREATAFTAYNMGYLPCEKYRQYTGLTISRLIKRGLVKRVKPGLYTLGDGEQRPVDERQIDMFRPQ